MGKAFVRVIVQQSGSVLIVINDCAYSCPAWQPWLDVSDLGPSSACRVRLECKPRIALLGQRFAHSETSQH